MDKLEEAKIIASVNKAIQNALEGSNEIWLSKEEFCKHFQMFTESWIDKHGKLLPRRQASVVNPDGKEKYTRWAYPVHETNRLLKEGKLLGMMKV